MGILIRDAVLVDPMQRGVVSISNSSEPSEMAHLARAIAFGDGNSLNNNATAGNATERVQKAAQAPIASSDADMAGLAYALSILTTFAPLLRSTSVFFRLWVDKMMLLLPWNTRISFLSGAVVGGVPGQGNVTRVTRIASDKVQIQPALAVGIVVFSREMLKWLSDAGEAFLNQELKRAITVAVDRAFLALITDGSTPSRVSIGGSAADAVDDVKFLLDSCNLTAESKPLFVMAPDVAIKASTLYESERVFPDVGPLGGSLLNIPAIVIDSLDAGDLALIDGAGIAGNVEGFQIANSQNAALQLDDAPDSPPTAFTNMVSLWQQNLVGLKPEIFFGAVRLRAAAFSKVTDIAWGEVT